MPKKATDYDLTTKAARKRLPPRGEPYFAGIGAGKSLGYKRLHADTNGVWLIRTWEAGKHSQRKIGEADDHMPPNGRDVFDWSQALRFVTNPTATATGGNVLVSEALKRHFDTMESGHREEYRRLANRHTVPALGGYRVDKLTSTRIEEWRTDYVKACVAKRKKGESVAEAERKAKASANRNLLTPLKAALTKAFNDPSNNIPTDKQWRTVKAYRDVDGRRHDHDLEAKQIATLIAHATTINPPLAPLIKASFLTGARLGELADVCARDYKADVSALWVNGKTKGRWVTLTKESAAFIQTLLKGRGRNDMLFPAPDGERWETRSRFSRFMDDVTEAAGLPTGKGGVCMYTLRHVYISRALEAGIPPNLVADNCGTSLRMIEKNYAHIIAAQRGQFLERGPSLQLIEGGKSKRKAA